MKLFEFSIAKYGLQINGGLSKENLNKLNFGSGYARKIGFCTTPYIYIRFYKIRLAFRFLIGVE